MSDHLNFSHQATLNRSCPPLLDHAANADFFHPEENDNPPRLIDISLDDVNVRQLKTLSDIEEIQHLRGEINLDLHRTLDPHFAEHEKKEMK